MNTKVTGVENTDGFFLQELESCHFSVTNLTVVLQLISNQLDSNAIFQNGVIQNKKKKNYTCLLVSSSQNLNILDLSHNLLKSANLGLQQQLKNLRELMLDSNQITELKKKDFSFLSNTSLNSLHLSSNPLKEVGSISTENQQV